MLTDRVATEQRDAMKARDEARTSVLRMLSTALKNERIRLMHDLSDEEELAVVRTLVKQYRDAIIDFTRGGRTDLVLKTEQEARMLEVYLPAAPSEEVVREVVGRKVRELGAASVKDFGKVMGAAMKELGNAASGDVVSKIVREALG